MKKPNDEFHIFCPSWSILVPKIGETRNTLNNKLKISVGKPEDVILSGKSRIRWDNIKIDVKEAGNNVGWTHLTQT
jgi:hypothetical protein